MDNPFFPGEDLPTGNDAIWANYGHLVQTRVGEACKALPPNTVKEEVLQGLCARLFDHNLIEEYLQQARVIPFWAWFRGRLCFELYRLTLTNGAQPYQEHMLQVYSRNSNCKNQGDADKSTEQSV